ncbi:hypothetical protein OCU04_008431 [Sclerotinia nivalis]|uniref:Uncharacterized protein n=1 Tax=Sclerotinia nivalis TaxID=352851 RepID=A0A9X0ALM6_9HELO|nr:hypothetical protein OCU04_008431 [Sclerotinia nivalis]
MLRSPLPSTSSAQLQLHREAYCASTHTPVQERGDHDKLRELESGTLRHTLYAVEKMIRLSCAI